MAMRADSQTGRRLMMMNEARSVNQQDKHFYFASNGFRINIRDEGWAFKPTRILATWMIFKNYVENSAVIIPIFFLV